MKPLVAIQLNNAEFEVWPDCVRTVFKDGKSVNAAPNEGETLLQTMIHEFLHSAIQEAISNSPSVCLRGVADGKAREWNDEKRFEEGIAYSMTPRIEDLVKHVIDAQKTAPQFRDRLFEKMRSGRAAARNGTSFSGKTTA